MFIGYTLFSIVTSETLVKIKTTLKIPAAATQVTAKILRIQS